MRAESSRQILLVFMICMAIYGNGVRITGWMTIVHLLEMTALIKTKPATLESHAAVRGMNRPRSVAARRAFELQSQMQMSFQGFAWCVM